jgi:multiple sugar transport system permease protein
MIRTKMLLITASFLTAVWSLFPVYYAIVVSFAPPGMVPMKLGLPAYFTLDNWINVLFRGGMGEITFEANVWPFLLNSIIVAACCAILTMLIVLPAAYTFSRDKGRVSRTTLFALLFFRMIPPISLIIPLYVWMYKLGLAGSLLSLILGHLVYTVPLGAWLMKGFFDMIPIEIEEAASIDGASKFAILRKIVLPLSMPGTSVCITFSALISYIEYTFASVLLGPGNSTMPVRIAYFIQPHMILWRPLAATALLSVVPMIILFMAIQKYLVRGLTFGAIKG